MRPRAFWPVRTLAIGAGLAEWAYARQLPIPRPRSWRRLPLDLALSLVEALGERAARAFLSLFRVDEHGNVHTTPSLEAMAIGVLAALLVLAFQMVAVASYNAGFAHGMHAAAQIRWRP